MTSTSVTITVNRHDGTGLEFEVAGPSGLGRLGDLVSMALKANGVKDGEWSSLVVVVLGDPPPVSRRPSLRVVA